MFCPKCAGSPKGKCFLHSKEPNMIYFGGRFETSKSQDAFKKATNNRYNDIWKFYDIKNAYPQSLSKGNLTELKPNWYFRFIAWLNRANASSMGCEEIDCKSAMIIYTRKDKYTLKLEPY